jgi:hypothetical protein
MGFTVFLGNLPTWVAAEDIESWLASENLAADSIKVIRNHETQESKGFAFVRKGFSAPFHSRYHAVTETCLLGRRHVHGSP